LKRKEVRNESSLRPELALTVPREGGEKRVERTGEKENGIAPGGTQKKVGRGHRAIPPSRKRKVSSLVSQRKRGGQTGSSEKEKEPKGE